MKFLKLFEELKIVNDVNNIDKEKFYYRIRTDEPYFSIIINKLPIPDDYKFYFLRNNLLKKYKKVFIYLNRHGSWNKSFSDDYKKHGYIFGGEIDVDRNDLKNIKIKNYNL